MFFYLLPTPLLVLVAFRLYRLLRNYVAARQLHLPLIILPTSFDDPVWMLFRPLFRWVECLPFGLGSWYMYTDIGWPMWDKGRTAAKLGGTFVFVTPSNNQIVSVHPPLVNEIFKDLKTWIMPSPFTDFFTYYGQNVSSLNGPEWQRHRKITAPAFNEKTMQAVWEQSLEYSAKDLRFLSEGRCTLEKLRSDVSVFAMHVLAAVGFGQETDVESTSGGHKLTLMDSLGFILEHVFIMIIFAGLKAPDLMLPPALRRLKLCVAEFRMYMQEAVHRHLQSGKSAKPSLLQAMVQANEAEKNEKQMSSSGRPSYLTDSELYGNLFVFSLAGYETTAGTLTFTTSLLALHPEMQDWVTEEIDREFAGSTTLPGYQSTYPKLVRCMAVMYETLRLVAPGPQFLRSPTTPSTLPVSGPTSSINVQPGTLVTADLYALHLSHHWGPDAHDFNPRRFVTADPATGEERLTIPSFEPGQPAMFLPWIIGPRVCPGKKFSQVEFVALVAQLLSLYRIEVDVDGAKGETLDEARKTLEDVLDEKYFNISAHLRRPADAALRFVRRK